MNGGGESGGPGGDGGEAEKSIWDQLELFDHLYPQEPWGGGGRPIAGW